jgi:hypothetical protein
MLDWLVWIKYYLITNICKMGLKSSVTLGPGANVMKLFLRLKFKNVLNKPERLSPAFKAYSNVCGKRLRLGAHPRMEHLKGASLW